LDILDHAEVQAGQMVEHIIPFADVFHGPILDLLREER
jgi:hypothetical protein